MALTSRTSVSAWMHPAWHKVISCSLRRAPDQDRRLNLQKALFIQELTGQRRRLAPHHKVPLHIRTPYIQITVFQAKLFFRLQKNRNKGGLVFVDVRDRSGIIQVVFEEGKCAAALIEKAASLRAEYVVAVVGSSLILSLTLP